MEQGLGDLSLLPNSFYLGRKRARVEGSEETPAPTEPKSTETPAPQEPPASAPPDSKAPPAGRAPVVTLVPQFLERARKGVVCLLHFSPIF